MQVIGPPSTHGEGADGLLRAFCAARGIVSEPVGRERDLMLAELQKGYREYVARALEHTADFDTLPLQHVTRPAVRAQLASVANNTTDPDALPLADVLSRYFAELERTEALAAKTKSEKQDALSLMAELTSQKPPAHMTKADAQEVKAALFRLPKNRSKNPKTRGLPLSEMLELSGVEYIAARTMNVYLGHMQHFYGWAVSNGYAAENVFHGLRLRRTARGTDEGRKAFNADQLQIMFSHLTDVPPLRLARRCRCFVSEVYLCRAIWQLADFRDCEPSALPNGYQFLNPLSVRNDAALCLSPAAFLCLKDEGLRPRLRHKPICGAIHAAGGRLLFFLYEGLG